LPALVASAGSSEALLVDARRWLDDLQAGALPPANADFGDAAASAPLRAVVGELGLPALCRGVGALAEQVLRTLLWHLDRIVDHQPMLDRGAAIARVAADFRSAWQVELHGVERSLALLQGLGELAQMSWDELRGRLHAREWREAQRLSELLARLPALVELLRRLGRARRSVERRPDPPPPARPGPRCVPLRLVETRLPDAPGEIHGIRFSDRIERLLGSELAQVHHPVLHKLWRARRAEGRLLAWDSEAVLFDTRPDPLAPLQPAAPPEAPEALERGPIILALDTSGSMRGAPENIAKAVALEAVRVARREGRACKLLAFGGPDELVERDLGGDRAGIDALLDLLGQSFDGGTDVQSPIERAIERVHEARWASADLVVVSDGEFGCTGATLARLDAARETLGLRVQGILVGDRETLGLLDVCDAIHWVRDWRRYASDASAAHPDGFTPVHSQSLTALYFPNALSERAARHRR
ncbi:MAG: VWA domain-containing protein, partial [Betaproteobacteria bacterium]